MSHYTVLCITQTSQDAELEQLLAPYNEELPVEWNFDDDSEEGGYWHNPDAKWDWWQVGGRWPDQLLAIDGTRHDRLQRSELDITQMKLDAVDKAAQIWSQVDAVCRELPDGRSYDEVAAGYPDDERYKSARDEFWNQSRVKACKSISDWGAHDLFMDYQFVGYAAYIERETLRAVPGYAMLTAEAWIGAGDMGWFGVGSDTHETTLSYLRTADKIIDDLPASAWLTVVDCHI